MPRSFLLHIVLPSTVMSAVLLAGCDPLCVTGLSPPDKGYAYTDDAGVCVVVVEAPDGDDAGLGGSDAGTQEDGGARPVLEDAGTGPP
ncbi:hypothetical protein D7Y13_17305 [Corallococcus praedator]|uniref:Secreted protein n=1 Tax=Corallococcus praedator TaxID=2316724 RepID=A0ABX9QJ64_9BACT|nr:MULTISPECIES: hypothetical protein [Corallococcus]RKH08086.1 hypothetical protein D7X74_32360 [Corallococcus sp. CA047B]RKH32342.1 hypothetical protein D7X75_16185 [Corallococcus sp. CA031C]RKI07733.1 hypothetical protein D7Y13_17305 [Corallococcus praedator]